MHTINDFPKNLPEFEERFPNEAACRAFLVRARWPDGFSCPRCNSTGWQLEARPLFECVEGHQTSITSGTVFHGTRRPLLVWFRAIFLMSAQKSGLSAKNLMRLLGMRSYQTAWHWLHKLRRATVLPGRSLLGGEVELDECFLHGESKGKGRGCLLPVVIGAVEAGAGKAIGRTRLEFLDGFEKEPIIGFIERTITRGAVVNTDGLQTYEHHLPELGYVHRRHVKNPKAMPAIHRVFGLLQRWLLGTHHGAVSRKHLGWYLSEFAFRFNRRNSNHPGKLFARMIESAITTPAIEWRQLVGERTYFTGGV